MPELRRGFTAWETVVIVVLLIGLAFLLMRLWISGSVADQRRLSINRLEAVGDALAKYALDNGGQFPTTEQGLAALITRPTTEPLPHNWQGPYLADAEVIKDAWGRSLKYELVELGESSKKVPRVSSNGPDGEDGTDDDIKFWSDEQATEGEEDVAKDVADEPVGPEAPAQ